MSDDIQGVASSSWRGPHWRLVGVQAATRFAESEINFYRSISETNHAKWRFWQFTAIISASAATVFAAIPDNAVTNILGSYTPAAMAFTRAIPAAITTVASGILGTFAYRLESTRQAAAAQAIESELMVFQASKVHPSDAEADRTAAMSLADKVRAIVGDEIQSWRSSQQKPNA